MLALAGHANMLMEMREIPLDEQERGYLLSWEGPFRYSEGTLVPHPLGPKEVPEMDGVVYLVCGLTPLSRGSTLLYIGETKTSGSKRIGQHNWLKHEWQVEVFLAPVPDEDLRKEIEALLAYAHQPPYNSRLLAAPPAMKKSLRIWNANRFWGLYPEVSSRHPWNAK